MPDKDPIFQDGGQLIKEPVTLKTKSLPSLQNQTDFQTENTQQMLIGASSYIAR